MAYSVRHFLLFLCVFGPVLSSNEIRVKRETKNYTISCIMSYPYVMKNQDGDLIGFIPDLVEALAQRMKFTYRLKIVADGSYGMNRTGKWSGMIGEVVDKKADLAAADLTVTVAREKVVDFSVPFMATQLGMIVSHPSLHAKSEDGLFFFMQAFSPAVWGCIFVAFAAFSIIFFLQYRAIQSESNEKETFGNMALQSTMYTAGAFCLQSYKSYPRSTVGHIASCFWYTFTFILVTLFISSLVIILTAPKAVEYYETASDLMEDAMAKRHMDIGVVASGSTRAFFGSSDVQLYMKFHKYLESNPGSLVKSTQEGIDKVIEGAGTFAMVMESSTADYKANQMCNIAKVPGNLYVQRYYAFAFPQDAPYKKEFDEGILKINEGGVLNVLFHKWWRDTKASCPGTTTRFEGALSMTHVGGIFIILLIGLVLLLLVGIVQFVFSRRSGNRGQPFSA